MTRARPRPVPMHELFWKSLEGPAPAEGRWSTHWAVVFDPEAVAELSLAWPAGGPTPSEASWNGARVGAGAELAGRNLRAGLNRLDLRFPEGTTLPADWRPLLTQKLRVPLPRAHADTSRKPGPEEGEQIGAILDSLYAGRFLTAERMAQDFDRRSPGPLGVWIRMVVRLSAARFLGAHEENKEDAFGGLIVEYAPSKEIVPRVAAGLREALDLLVQSPASESLWRTLGESLCLAGECELGYECLMYACLIRPTSAYTWAGFYMTYEAGALRDDLLKRRAGEIREAALAACEIPAFSYDRHLHSFLQAGIQQLSSGDGPVRVR